LFKFKKFDDLHNYSNTFKKEKTTRKDFKKSKYFLVADSVLLDNARRMSAESAGKLYA